VRETPATSIDRGRFETAQAATTERGQAIVGLARDFGLRSKEACLINARSALHEAKETGRVTVVYGTKGGRVRLWCLSRTSDRLSRCPAQQRSRVRGVL